MLIQQDAVLHMALLPHAEVEKRMLQCLAEFLREMQGIDEHMLDKPPMNVVKNRIRELMAWHIAFEHAADFKTTLPAAEAEAALFLQR